MKDSHIGQHTPPYWPRRQEHLEWVQNSCKTGTCGTSSAQYLSEQVLKARFANDADSPLKLLLSEQGLNPSLAAHVAKTHTKVFAILLDINHASYLEYFVEKGLHDGRLPFRNSADFPISAQDLSDSFIKKQWKYCAPHLEGNLRRSFDPLEILPFSQDTTPIGEGGSARIYKIDVDPEYDQLTGPNGTSEPYPRTPTKALKSYYTPESQTECKSECEAYLEIGSRRGLLTCFGRYDQNGAHHCILELASGGSLQDMFEQSDAPRTTEEIMAFWTSLFGTAEALQHIHTIQPPSSDSDSVTLGWHQDIKPSNIMICGESPVDHNLITYDRPLKIGDLGSSHFKSFKEIRAMAVDRDTYGSRTYGAPEVYRSDKTTITLRKSVSNVVDIWSLGAVFSECIVYVHEGRRGLYEFQQRREEETRRIPNFQDRGCFHNGQTRLQCVDDMLDRIEPAATTRGDFVTVKLIELVRDMLGEQHERPHAYQLHPRCQRILNEGKKRIQMSSTMIGPHSSNSLPTPPQPLGPPPQRPEIGSISSILGSHMGPFPVNTPPKTISTKLSEQSENLVHSHSPTDLDSVKPGTSTIRSAFEGVNSQGHSRNDVRDQQFINGKTSNGSSNAKRGTSRDPKNGVSSTPFGEDVEVWPIDELLAWHRGTITQKHSFRKVLVGQAAYPEPGGGKLSVLNQVAKREHVFLIDDATSMAPHMTRVRSLVGAMVKLIKYAKLDKSGVDVHFAVSQDRLLNQRDATPIMDMIGRVDASAIRSNLPGSLEGIIKGYTRQLRRNNPGPGLSLYVLTDGVWQTHCDARQQIKDLVDTLESYGELRNVGIQFIRFGNDEYGARRLEALDKLKKTWSLKRDVVDHTAYDDGRANVWKIMLGATVVDYDGDETEEE